MISDSLLSCLEGNPRKLHEQYLESKMNNLYKVILHDDGESLKILQLIEKSTNEAKVAIDKEERRKREIATVVQASMSLDSDGLRQAKEAEAARG